jgi:tetratricopeptide (TPR) repeat protein
MPNLIPAWRCLAISSVLWLLPLLATAGIEPLLNKGLALLNAGQINEAIAVLHDARQQALDRSQVDNLLGQAYLRLGMQQLTNGDEAAGRRSFAEAKHYLPDDPQPWQGTAIAWLREGQPAAAIGEIGEALAIAGERLDLLILLGQAHYAGGDLVQAEEAWQKASEIDATTEVTALLAKVRRERQAETAMRRDLAGRFTLAYAPGVSNALASAVLETLQDAYSEVGRELGYYPDTDIPVLLYAREDFAAVTRSPEWAGAVYDGKIRVPLGGIQQMTAPLKALLYHEYTHVVVRFLGKGRVPVWLNEGLAETVGRRQYDPWRGHVTTAGKILSADALNQSFARLPAELVPLAYQTSYERVNRLIALCGWPSLGELMQRLGTGVQWDDAVSAAYAPCGYDWPRLQVELGDELH